MAANDKPARPVIRSYASTDPELAKGNPKSLRELRALRESFNGRRSEPQRSDQGRGSEMVGKDRPRPELKPKHEQGPIRESFNQAWLKEARAAHAARYREQRAANDQGHERSREAPPHTRGPQR